MDRIDEITDWNMTVCYNNDIEIRLYACSNIDSVAPFGKAGVIHQYFFQFRPLQHPDIR